MGLSSLPRKSVAIAAACAVVVGGAAGVALTRADQESGPRYRGYLERVGGEEEAEAESEHGVEAVVGGPSSESSEIFSALTSVANARLAPYGSVAAGQLSTSLGSFRGLPSNASVWSEQTNLDYDADDPNYRDPEFSNSSGGAGFVGGRITGLAAGGGYLFAGGANGGVFRKKLNAASVGDDGAWEPISDGILSLSTGDLEWHDNALWYATGEANTSATSYVG
ncbi:MAG: glycosyl hydrolase, partial [Sporichthyaceae bacterium]